MFINIIKCSQTFSTVNFERCEITLWYVTGLVHQSGFEEHVEEMYVEGIPKL